MTRWETTCFDVEQWHKHNAEHENKKNLQINRQKLGILRELNIRYALCSSLCMCLISNSRDEAKYQITSYSVWLLFSYAGCCYIFIFWIYLLANCWQNECTKRAADRWRAPRLLANQWNTNEIIQIYSINMNILSAMSDNDILISFRLFFAFYAYTTEWTTNKKEPYPVSVRANVLKKIAKNRWFLL